MIAISTEEAGRILAAGNGQAWADCVEVQLAHRRGSTSLILYKSPIDWWVEGYSEDSRLPDFDRYYANEEAALAAYMSVLSEVL